MPEDDSRERESLHEVSVVVPVYQGEQTLEALADEVAPLVAPQKSPRGRRFRSLQVPRHGHQLTRSCRNEGVAYARIYAQPCIILP